jgi:hypothetical protein
MKSKSAPRILIVVHRRDKFEKVGYLVKEIAKFWQEMGFRIEVHRGLDSAPDADVVILHVDLTVMPDDYLAFVQKYPVVINGRVADISKNRISSFLVRRGDGYTGPVIVKTNRNSGGRTEAFQARARMGLPKLIYTVRRILPWSLRANLRDYRIFPSVDDVPFLVWFNRDLVVERFQPERREDYYCLRTWVFLGDRETNSISYSYQPVVKSSNVVQREPVAEVPEELREVRKRMGFDFGKFDYGIVNGTVVLYDVNRTPTLGGAPSEAFMERIGFLAEGVDFYLRPSSPS